MPELGKATYLITLDSAQYMSGLEDVDAATIQTTDNAAAAWGRVDGSFQASAKETQSSGQMMIDGFEQTGAAATTAATEVSAAATEMGAATAGAAAKSGAAAEKSASGWAMLGARTRKFGSTGAMGSMVGLGAAYLVLSGGYHWLKDSQQGWLLVRNSLQATNDVSGTTASGLSKLADTYVKLTGNSRGLNLQVESMLLRFQNIRNIGPGLGMIYNRTFAQVQNIAEATGRSVQTVATQVGKAMQDPAKYMTSLSRAGVVFTASQIEITKQLEATKGVAAAQAYVLQVLDTRYGGLSTHTEDTAHKLQGSLNVQLKLARDQIDQAGASIEKAFIPALLQIAHIVVPLTKFLAEHANIIRKLVLAYIAAKIAAILLTKAWDAMKAIQTVLKLSTEGLSTATKANTVADGEAETATTGLTGAMKLEALQFGLLAAATYVAVRALDHYIDKAKEAQKQASTALAGEHRTEDTKFGQAAMVFNLQVGRHERQGMTHAEAVKAATREAQRIDPLFGTKAGAKQYKKELDDEKKKHGAHQHHYAKKPGKELGTISQSDIILGTRYNALEDAYLKAEMTATKKDDVRSLRALQAYLQNRLKTDKNLDPDQKASLQKTLASVHKQLDTARGISSTTGQRTAVTGQNLIPASMRISLSKAQREAMNKGNYKPEIKALGDEQAFLQQRLKHTKDMKERAAIEAELTSVEKQLTDAKKAELAAGGDLTKQMQKMVEAAMDLRGTWFSQFSSSVFHKDDRGGAIPGSATGSGHTVNQHITYQHDPGDRHAHARHVRKAARAAIAP